MKKIFIVFLTSLFVFGCNLKTNLTVNNDPISDEPTKQNYSVSEINCKYRYGTIQDEGYACVKKGWQYDPKVKYHSFDYIDSSFFIPPEKNWDLSYVEDLYAINCFSNEVPKWLTKFYNVKSVLIGSNEIKKIDKTICKLKKLSWLNLAHNSLTDIPPCLCELDSLTYIVLAVNDIIKFSKAFECLPYGITIDIAENPIPDEEIKRFKKLRPDITLVMD